MKVNALNFNKFPVKFIRFEHEWAKLDFVLDSSSQIISCKDFFFKTTCTVNHIEKLFLGAQITFFVVCVYCLRYN